MRDIVINTGPIIALVAATESLEWLPTFYDSNYCITRMQFQGIWVSDALAHQALAEVGEA